MSEILPARASRGIRSPMSLIRNALSYLGPRNRPRSPREETFTATRYPGQGPSSPPLSTEDAGRGINTWAVLDRLAPVRADAQDQRSSEEIDRTRVLHRAGPAFGLDDLPALRDGLGQSQQATPQQRELARTYGPRLAQAEVELHAYLGFGRGDSRRQGALNALRTTAHGIQEDAEQHHDGSELLGVDYDSITRQLAILFRRVDDDDHVQSRLEPARVPGQDRRTPEEIERTRVLHRRGPALGLANLPALRAGLGQQATPQQQELARTYGPRLAQAETELQAYLSFGLTGDRPLQPLNLLRATAYAIQEDAERHHESSAILGVDYESITRHLAILFGQVTEPAAPAVRARPLAAPAGLPAHAVPAPDAEAALAPRRFPASDHMAPQSRIDRWRLYHPRRADAAMRRR
jgi:hypothetical protein